MTMQVSKTAVMAIKAYQHQAKLLFNDYLLADPFIPYTSVIGGVLLCKLIYDLSQFTTLWYYKGYAGLMKIQRAEWGNRCISTAHAIFISGMALYLVFLSDVFSDSDGPITFKSSSLSTFALGISVGYFISDLGMIAWSYPSLGGLEYIVHHLLSVVAVAYSMLSGEGQVYTFMVLISEITTPCVNMRWFLDTAGMKMSRLYLLNGVVLFFGWLIARILLFGYIYHHVYLHYYQVKQMFFFGFFLVFVVPFALAVMNLMWFGKILKGLKKILAKRQQTD
ncbi:uncharacterized protein LOC116267526 isoform X1 [Nymphaea colorata]|uniref:uncharacterized protein LOC116267526 isoform X1 n=2 Tax=Nymphaea colorata TaxID=210225 RepID=UPI00129D5D99|nr:uncharacterized protein LOC116267526 isoform X1 [Nymphaea colorata]XP_031505156.1 uncharacterized protein LOC116267526 isoform X1 [Nymphaea colorata]XP_031505157.1 uncharacterized protein LOC116267526 isoform X1 [Nymphaea colorata]